MNKEKKAKEFIEDIIEVYKKHNLSLAHEDTGGCFEIRNYTDFNIKWLNHYKIRF